LVTIEGGESQSLSKENALASGRVEILYAMSRYWLSFPFALLCAVASLMERPQSMALAVAPLFFIAGTAIYSYGLKSQFGARGAGADPHHWARRYAILSGIWGTIWGLGAVVWFVPGSFASQAFLVLAFLGMSAVECVVRALWRPAYLAHATGSLVPLAALLVHEGGTYQILSAVLLLSFAGILSYCADRLALVLDERILPHRDTSGVILRLREEKRAVEAMRDVALAGEQAKSDLLSNIGHELRTPLDAISGMAELLEHSDLEKAQRNHVKVLLEASQGLTTLLDDIIAISQPRGLTLPAPQGGCDIDQSARTITRLFQPRLWQKRLHLSVNSPAELPHAAVDPQLFRRVLLKLLGNAIKFTERGSIEITLGSTIDASGSRSVRITVADTGPGIPSEILTTIFEPFMRDGYASRHKGTGLGLAAAKRLVELASGDIGVESEPGLGTKFWFSLPALAAYTAEGQDNEEHVTPPSGLSLLTYLPDQTMRSTVEGLLASFGNSVSNADTLWQAVTMSARGGYALIVAPAESVDAFAAVPGQRTPILALAVAEDRHPDGADRLLRWPAGSEALFSAIVSITGDGQKRAEGLREQHIDAAIDAKAISDLEKSLGFKTLIDILQSYMHTADELAVALTETLDKEDWCKAARLAQDFAGAAGGLGLGTLTSAARLLSQNARDGATHHALFAAADSVLSEHTRVRQALCRLYPDLAA
jgi:signal transduction histidine kinase